MVYVTPLDAEWSNLTFIFYLFIIFAAYFFSASFGRVKVKFGNYRKTFPINLYLVFLLLVFVKGFLTCGRDVLRGYYNNFISASSFSGITDQSLEIGYKLLNVVVRNVFHEYWVFLLIIAILTILPPIYMIYKYCDYIDTGVAVLLYTSIFFFPGFSAMRIYLAGSIGLLAFDALIEKKAKRALFWIIASMSIHTSMVCLFVPFFLIMFKHLNRKLTLLIFTVVFVVVYIARDSIVAGFTGRYSLYGEFTTVSIGLQQFIYYIPIFILLYMAHKWDNNDEIFRISIIFTASGLFFGMLGYVISIFGRIQAGFIPLIIIIAYYYKSLEMNQRNTAKIVKLILVIYCIIRFYVYISEYYNIDEIMPYSNLFGWVW